MVQASTGFTEADVLDQRGRCMVVTGANTGIGYEAARVLAARGARVLLACRDRSKAEDAIARIGRSVPKADLAFVPYDQADLDSIRRAAERISREPSLDALINNAGIMNPPYALTKQGFELQFGVNHLGCFALTALLLPKLAEAAAARIVVTSSLVHKSGEIAWDDLDARKSYDKRARYNQSKLANALFLFELDRRLRAAGSPVTAVGCHPGFATTELGRHIPGIRLIRPLFGLIANTPAMGAWPTLHAATGPVTPGGYYGPQGRGEIRGPSGEAVLAPRATDPVAARRLWDVSVAMTKIDPGLPSSQGSARTGSGSLPVEPNRD